jgi:putative flippase GtrA
MRNLLRQFLQRDAHPAIQFVKYGLAGGLATAVDILIFFLLAWLAFPALLEGEKLVQWSGIQVTPVAEALRLRNFVINSAIAFLFSNLTAYIANVLWVFEPGRHHRAVEIGLFYAVSLTSIVVGTALGGALIKWFGLSTTASYLAKMFASVMINYVCRKFIIFKG